MIQSGGFTEGRYQDYDHDIIVCRIMLHSVPSRVNPHAKADQREHLYGNEGVKVQSA